MTAERSATFEIVDAIMKERAGGPVRTRREWERFVEDKMDEVFDGLEVAHSWMEPA